MFEYSNWSILTICFVIVLFLALNGVALCAVLYLVGAQWRSEVRKLAVNLYALFPLAGVLLAILLLGGEHTFPWIGHVSHGEDVHMPGWYTLPLLAAREITALLVAMYLWKLFIQRQELADRTPEDAARFHTIATWIPFFYVLYGTMVAWDFGMTLKPSWHSPIFSLYYIVSNFGLFLSFVVGWVYVLNTRSVLKTEVKPFVYNYIAQMMLAFTLLWIYTFFAQYLTMWYGNLPDETDRIFAMQNGDFSFFWWSMITLKFIIPFASLCFPVVRHSPVAVNFVASCIIIGTLFEQFNWVIASIQEKGSVPVLAALAVGGAVLFAGFTLVRSSMRKNQLLKV